MTFGEYSTLQAKVDRNTPASDPNRQQMHQFLKTMPGNWTSMKKYTAMPSQNYQVHFGRVIPLGENKQFGVAAALTYRNEQDIEKRSLFASFQQRFQRHEQ